MLRDYPHGVEGTRLCGGGDGIRKRSPEANYDILFFLSFIMLY